MDTCEYCWVVVRYLFSTGANFSNLSITNQMWRKIHFALIQILMNWSLHFFAHGTTAALSWHVQKFIAISSPGMELHEINFTLKLNCEKALVKWMPEQPHIWWSEMKYPTRPYIDVIYICIYIYITYKRLRGHVPICKRPWGDIVRV